MNLVLTILRFGRIKKYYLNTAHHAPLKWHKEVNPPGPYASYVAHRS